MSHSPSRSPMAVASAAVLLLALGVAGPAAAAHPDLSGFWEPRNGSMKRGEPAALTQEAIADNKERAKTNDVANGVTFSSRNCLPVGQPWMLQQSAPIDVVQEPRETTMMFEGHAIPWHIYTDGRGHPAPDTLKLTVNGHSIGRWEGDTFVVDTVGFSGRNDLSIGGQVHNTPTGHLVERFTLAADGQEMHAHFVYEDPMRVTKPYAWDFVWFRSAPGTYAFNEVCDASKAAFGKY